jgi:CsoR family transcriptional regulator, copper-sensing transcriptional repressor
MRKSKKACHDPVDHSQQLPRLRRIEGQVRGLQQMIADQRYCLDVINQMGAITAALRRVQGDMLREHLAAISRSSICGKLSGTDREELAEEVSGLLKRLG